MYNFVKGGADKLDSKVGERIRELREIQCYTREVFAEKVNISAKFLYEVEVGKKGFSAETLSKIAKALSVSCDYIMTGEDPNKKGNEKIICVLEMIEPKQKSRIKEILDILARMCDIV